MVTSMYIRMFNGMYGATAATSSCSGPGVRSAVQRGSSVAPAAIRTKLKIQPLGFPLLRSSQSLLT